MYRAMRVKVTNTSSKVHSKVKRVKFTPNEKCTEGPLQRERNVVHIVCNIAPFGLTFHSAQIEIHSCYIGVSSARSVWHECHSFAFRVRDYHKSAPSLNL